ncbi:hypothetical protein D3C73_1041310 [compost metagenome]
MIFYDINPQLMYLERLIKQDRLVKEPANLELRKVEWCFEKFVNIFHANKK